MSAFWKLAQMSALFCSTKTGFSFILSRRKYSRDVLIPLKL